MIDFKDWWSESGIIAGEGSMDAAEQAWDSQEDEIERLRQVIHTAHMVNCTAVSCAIDGDNCPAGEVES